MLSPPQAPFARRLASERHRLQLTQAAVADAAGVSVPSQIGYEQGARSPPTDYIVLLRDVGFDPHFLMFGQTAADFAFDTLDWGLVGRIVNATLAWCETNGAVLSEERLAESTRLLYNEYRRKPETQAINVDRVLRLFLGPT